MVVLQHGIGFSVQQSCITGGNEVIGCERLVFRLHFLQQGSHSTGRGGSGQAQDRYPLGWLSKWILCSLAVSDEEEK